MSRFYIKNFKFINLEPFQHEKKEIDYEEYNNSLKNLRYLITPIQKHPNFEELLFNEEEKKEIQGYRAIAIRPLQKRWRENPKGIILIIPSPGLHSELYFPIFDPLSLQGYITIAFDWFSNSINEKKKRHISIDEKEKKIQDEEKKKGINEGKRNGKEKNINEKMKFNKRKRKQQIVLHEKKKDKIYSLKFYGAIIFLIKKINEKYPNLEISFIFDRWSSLWGYKLISDHRILKITKQIKFIFISPIVKRSKTPFTFKITNPITLNLKTPSFKDFTEKRIKKISKSLISDVLIKPHLSIEKTNKQLEDLIINDPFINSEIPSNIIYELRILWSWLNHSFKAQQVLNFSVLILTGSNNKNTGQFKVVNFFKKWPKRNKFFILYENSNSNLIFDKHINQMIKKMKEFIETIFQ